MQQGEAIVTGGSGFLGARVIDALLRRGWLVRALGRPRGPTPWDARMRRALEELEGAPIEGGRLAGLLCYNADIVSPDLALAPPLPGRAGGAQAVLFHLAGDTHFRPAAPERQRRVNVHAGPNLVRTLRGRVDTVVHVSTAYVCGTRRGRVYEHEADVGQGFHNPYESTKLEGELAMRDVCREQGVPLIVLRPSIILNDSRTGRSCAATHLNALLEVVGRIQAHFGLGFGETPSDRVRILADPRARPNLAPVDAVVPALLRLALHPGAPGRTYHICHPAPGPMDGFLALLLNALGLSGKLALRYVDRLEAPVTYAEKLIVRALGPYGPYLNSDVRFDLANTRRLIPDYDGLFPPLATPYLNKVIEFHRVQRERESRHELLPVCC